MSSSRGLDLLCLAVEERTSANRTQASRVLNPDWLRDKLKEINDLARLLEWYILRLLDPQHRERAIKFTYTYTYTNTGRKRRKKGFHRSSIVHTIFKKQLLEGEIDKEEVLLQELKDELSKIRTGRTGGDVELSDDMEDVFQRLCDSIKDLQDTNDDRDAALRALQGRANYLPCHPFAAAHFVHEHLPTSTTHLDKKTMSLITCQTGGKYFDKKRLTRRDGYVNDLFLIVFTLYYWPYAKIESNGSLSVFGNRCSGLKTKDVKWGLLGGRRQGDGET